MTPNEILDLLQSARAAQLAAQRSAKSSYFNRRTFYTSVGPDGKPTGKKSGNAAAALRSARARYAALVQQRTKYIKKESKTRKGAARFSVQSDADKIYNNAIFAALSDIERYQAIERLYNEAFQKYQNITFINNAGTPVTLKKLMKDFTMSDAKEVYRVINKDVVDPNELIKKIILPVSGKLPLTDFGHISVFDVFSNAKYKGQIVFQVQVQFLKILVEHGGSFTVTTSSPDGTKPNILDRLISFVGRIMPSNEGQKQMKFDTIEQLQTFSNPTFFSPFAGFEIVGATSPNIKQVTISSTITIDYASY